MVMNGARSPHGLVVFWILLLAALPAAGQEVRLVERTGGVQIDFFWDGAPASAGAALKALEAHDFGLFMPPGNPEIPYRTLRVAVPPEGEIGWTVEGLEETLLAESLPVRQGLADDWDPKPADALPAGAVEFGGEGWFRQVRFLTFRLHPLRQGADGAVLTRRVTLAVDFPRSTGVTVRDHPAFDSAYGRLFVNDWRDKGLPAGSKIEGQEDRRAGGQEDRRAERQEGRRADGQEGRKAGGQESRGAGKRGLYQGGGAGRGTVPAFRGGWRYGSGQNYSCTAWRPEMLTFVIMTTCVMSCRT